ncbi:phospholipase-like protein [Tanacetum coccineum]
MGLGGRCGGPWIKKGGPGTGRGRDRAAVEGAGGHGRRGGWGAGEEMGRRESGGGWGTWEAGGGCGGGRVRGNEKAGRAGGRVEEDWGWETEVRCWRGREGCGGAEGGWGGNSGADWRRGTWSREVGAQGRDGRETVRGGGGRESRVRGTGGGEVAWNGGGTWEGAERGDGVGGKGVEGSGMAERGLSLEGGEGGGGAGEGGVRGGSGVGRIGRMAGLRRGEGAGVGEGRGDAKGGRKGGEREWIEEWDSRGVVAWVRGSGVYGGASRKGGKTVEEEGGGEGRRVVVGVRRDWNSKGERCDSDVSGRESRRGEGKREVVERGEGRHGVRAGNAGERREGEVVMRKEALGASTGQGMQVGGRRWGTVRNNCEVSGVGSRAKDGVVSERSKCGSAARRAWGRKGVEIGGCCGVWRGGERDARGSEESGSGSAGGGMRGRQGVREDEGGAGIEGWAGGRVGVGVGLEGLRGVDLLGVESGAGWVRRIERMGVKGGGRGCVEWNSCMEGSGWGGWKGVKGVEVLETSWVERGEGVGWVWSGGQWGWLRGRVEEQGKQTRRGAGSGGSSLGVEGKGMAGAHGKGGGREGAGEREPNEREGVGGGRLVLGVPQPQPPSKLIIKPLHPIINALISKGLVKHPDMNVNMSVACCICEILRITAPNVPYNHEQLKEYFEVVVTSFEKLCSVSGGYYGKMTRVLEVFSKARLPVLMLDLQMEGHRLIVRLFKHFLNVSDSNSTAIVLYMENIMSMIIEKNEELAHVLQALVITSLKKDNQIASPVCWQFGKKALMICAAKLKLHLPDMARDMSIAVYDYPQMVAQICKTASEHNVMEVNEAIPYTNEANKLRKDTSHKILVTCREGSINMVQTLGHCQEALNPFNSATELNVKRKRDNEKAQSVTEVLVVRRIKIWWAGDEIYRQGVVKSFDCILKMHKLLLDDGFEVVVDLKQKRWMLSENVSARPHSRMREAMPKRVLSPHSGIICVQGYKVKSINAPILEAIFKKHGDIAAKCVFPDAMRTYLLEAVCEIVRRIETSDVSNIISKMEEIEGQVSVAEVAKINVAWLRAYLDTIHKMNEAQEKSTTLMEMKTNTTLVKMAAKTDQKESYDEFVGARSRLVKAQRCVKVLELVEKKLNNNLLESKAEKDLWARQPVI